MSLLTLFCELDHFVFFSDVGESTQTSFWSFMGTIKQSENNSSKTAEPEITRYLNEPLVPITGNVFEWWRSQQFIYPKLTKLARMYLSIPATSVPSERVFSVAGNLVTSRRESLLPANVECLTFLHDNLRVLNS